MMDLIQKIFTTIRAIIVHPMTRVVVVVAAVAGVAYGGWWYIMRYRPQTYLNTVYPSWDLFERAVLATRAREYQYDPYGQLSVNLKDVYESGQAAKEQLSKISPPTKNLQEVQRKSLVVIDQYLAIKETIETDVKKEADYYYGLLGELKSFFENQDPTVARIRLNDQALTKSNFYEETWNEYQLLDGELSQLTTKVQIASVPSRLKDFHTTLIQLLRDSHEIAANGIGVYRSFTTAISDKKFFESYASLASLASRIDGVELAPVGSGLSSVADVNRYISSPSTAARQEMDNMIKQQVDLEKLSAYIPFFIEVQKFFQKYSGSFAPPILSLVGGGEKLSDINTGSEPYAVKWAKYDAMTQDLEALIAFGRTSSPPSTALAFHTELMGTLQGYLPKAKEALLKFKQFNEVLSGDQFQTLERDIARLKSISTSNLDFASVWNLRDIVSSQTNTGSDFDAVSRAWVDELTRYRILEAPPTVGQ